MSFCLDTYLQQSEDYEILLASRMVMGRVPDMFNGYLEKNIESNNVKS